MPVTGFFMLDVRVRISIDASFCMLDVRVRMDISSFMTDVALGLRPLGAKEPLKVRVS